MEQELSQKQIGQLNSYNRHAQQKNPDDINIASDKPTAVHEEETSKVTDVCQKNNGWLNWIWTK